MTAPAIAEPTQEFQFYPTPPKLIEQLINPYRRGGGLVLEPSAGRGDIADAIKKAAGWQAGYKVLCCEISADLRAVLVEKGHRVIGTDFLKLAAPYLFNLVVMNPPFLYAAEHVGKAWSMLRPGGNLAAIVPANFRDRRGGAWKELAILVDAFGEVEHVGQAFVQSERSTDVECVIIRLEKPDAPKFEPFANYKPREDAGYVPPEDHDLPAPRDLVKAIVQQYEAAATALRGLHDAETLYRRYAPESATKYDSRNEYTEQVDKLKEAFWNLIFQRTRIGELTTSGYQQEFMAKRAVIVNLEFSEETIYEVLHIFMSNRVDIVDKCIMDVFREATLYSHDNRSVNETWKTNKSWKINPKIIVPGAVTRDFGWRLSYYQGYKDFLVDLDKVITMFGGKYGICTVPDIEQAMQNVNNRITSYDQKFVGHNFDFRFFKKGTLHLYWNDLKALEGINRYAAQKGMWQIGSGN